MAISIRVEALEEVDASLHSHYVADEENGGFVLELDGVHPDSEKLTEMNQNNKALNRKVAQLNRQLAAFGELTPEEVEQLKGATEELDALRKKVEEGGNLDEEAVKQRVDAVKRELTDQLNKVTKARDELTRAYEGQHQQLSRLKVTQSLRSAIEGVAQPRQGAWVDIESRATADLIMDEDGEVIPNSKSPRTIDPKTGETVGTVEDWAKLLVAQAPHLFDGSGGGGASGGAGGKTTRDTGGRRRITENADGVTVLTPQDTKDILSGKATMAE